MSVRLRMVPVECACAVARRLLVSLLLAAGAPGAAPAQQPQPDGASPDLLAELKGYPHRILVETKREGNWELYRLDADGSRPANLTNTPDVDEVYPKASPDGARICFEADEGAGESRARNLYVMNADGGGRRKIADNAREPCWTADGKQVAFLKGEFEKYSLVDFATRGIFVYDLASGTTREHPNPRIKHLYTLNASADGKWYIAVVHGGMGFSHNIIALEAGGEGVFDLRLSGCRPDVSPDDRYIAWGHGDYKIGVATLDLQASPPAATRHWDVVTSKEPIETYHADWSPDAHYIAFSLGAKREKKDLHGLLPEFPGVEAPGWNICVADARATNRWVQITFDGQSNKEPDWQKSGPAGSP